MCLDSHNIPIGLICGYHLSLLCIKEVLGEWKIHVKDSRHALALKLI
jgi:hypothetical protein